MNSCADSTLRLWKLLSGATQAIFTFDAKPVSRACSADAKTIVVGDLGGQLHVFDLIDAALPAATSVD